VGTRRYAIIGTGAVGGFYGARLARAGLDVHFLLHNDFDHVREHGLTVDSCDGDFVLPHVQAYGRAADLPPADVVVVALKTTQNARLADLLPGPARGGGVVLTLQNGYGVEEAAARVVGPDRVMAGLCFLCSNKVGPGHIRHLDYGFVTLADYAADGRPRGITDRMRAVAADLRAAGIEVEFAEDLVLARWRKLIWNVPFSGLSVVLDSTSDRLMADPHTRRLAEDLMREVAAGARAFGRTIGEDFIRHMMDLTDRMTPYRTSMQIDCDRKRPMEVEAIFGNPLRAAAEAGADLPRLAALYALLKFIDARNLAAAGAEADR
jgi:2-dehydropantoate 2-reductase